ncbi:MAG: PhzF family phenazine biosynthesis isomerase [Gammaproteobacteria bacterium]|nr:PhzF family phenazine biosynthesis isomerase [Gammaproteobacteria bacterium]
MPPAELRQAFARETNLSETTFVMESPDADGSWPVAIHTPEFELPFAGHPVLGTAWAVREDAGGSDEVVLATGQGPVTVRFEGEGPGALTWLEAPAVTVLEESDPRRLAAALAIPAAALDPECFRPSLADVGPRFHLVALTERRYLARLKPDGAVLSALLAASGATGVLVVAPADEGEGQFAARMFFDAGGLREDPATGSAACCLAELLRDRGWSGRVRITQGSRCSDPRASTWRSASRVFRSGVGCSRCSRGGWANSAAELPSSLSSIRIMTCSLSHPAAVGRDAGSAVRGSPRDPLRMDAAAEPPGRIHGVSRALPPRTAPGTAQSAETRSRQDG